MNNKEMKYKVLPHANVLMSTDGTKQLFIKVGSEVIPAGLPRASVATGTEWLDYGEFILSDEESLLVESLLASKTPIVMHINLLSGLCMSTVLSNISEETEDGYVGGYYGTVWMGASYNMMLLPGDLPETLGKWVLNVLPDILPEEAAAEEA